MRPLRMAVFAMGTRFELLLEDRPESRPIGEAVLGEIQRIDSKLSLFRADSEVARLNREAALRAVPVDRETMEWLELCQVLHLETLGRFDPGLGELMSVLGLRGGPSWTGEELTHRISEVLENGGFQHVELETHDLTVHFRRPLVSLDLGAIAKGFALDAAREILTEHRVQRALLHGGTSSVLGLGSPPGGEAWKVEIRTPGSPESRLAEVWLRDQALSVSTPKGGVAGGVPSNDGHILDPAIGRSARSCALSAVVHRDAAVAEAWSTALIAGGDFDLTERWRSRSIAALTLGSGSPPPCVRTSGPMESIFHLGAC